jgi:hypothetical protein
LPYPWQEKGTPEDLRTLYLGIIAHNPGNIPGNDRYSASIQPFEPTGCTFVDLPPFVNNNTGSVYAGPGVVGKCKEYCGDFGKMDFPAKITIEPMDMPLAVNQDIPVRPLTAPIIGRSALLPVRSGGPVYFSQCGKVRTL